MIQESHSPERNEWWSTSPNGVTVTNLVLVTASAFALFPVCDVTWCYKAVSVCRVPHTEDRSEDRRR